MIKKYAFSSGLIEKITFSKISLNSFSQNIRHSNELHSLTLLKMSFFEVK